MEKQRVNEARPAVRRSPPPRKRPRPFRRTYLTILAVLLTLSAVTLVYVHSALRRYESSQPENYLAEQMKKIKKVKSLDKFEEQVSLEPLRQQGLSQEALDQFRKDLLSTDITFQEDHSALDPTRKVFDMLSNGCKVGSASLRHEGQKTCLLIFTLDEWSVESLEASGYEFHLTVPASVTVQSDGQTLEGTVSDGQATYDVFSLSPLNIELLDILGNSVPYDQKNLPAFTDFTVTVPFDYTIRGAGDVPKSAAVLEPPEELKYVKEYCPDVVDSATYVLSLLTENPDFQILDGSGSSVDFTVENRQVTIRETPVGQDTLPLTVDIDPLEVAKLWSLFMTMDLTGQNHGYGQLSPYLIQGSYLQDVAWKWATGQDITFTSTHTLKDPPFQVEEISNYIVYSPNCFSCDIRLEKKLVLTRTGEEVDDKIHSTFYFVKYDDTDNGKDDPHWVLADSREIL